MLAWKIIFKIIASFFIGQKPILTDVQAELDRISQKPDLVSPTTPMSPTEGGAS